MVIFDVSVSRRAALSAQKVTSATRPSKTIPSVQIPYRARYHARLGTIAQTAPSTPPNSVARMARSAIVLNWRVLQNARLVPPACTALKVVCLPQRVSVREGITARSLLWFQSRLMVLVATSVHRVRTAQPGLARVFRVHLDSSVQAPVSCDYPCLPILPIIAISRGGNNCSFLSVNHVYTFLAENTRKK